MAGQAAAKTRAEVIAKMKSIECGNKSGASGSGGDPHGPDKHNVHGIKHDGSSKQE